MVLKSGERRRGEGGNVLERGQLTVKVRNKGKKEERRKVLLEEMWHFWSEAGHRGSRAVISRVEKGALWIRILIFFE